jgi:NhaP-type Na+/H+ or K+/H+ antiporter
MTHGAWFLMAGAVLLGMAFFAAKIERLPLTTAMFYLAAGLVLGPTALGLIHINPLEQSALLELITEIGVLISVFAAGVKLSPPVGDRLWWVPFRLASVSMLVSVALMAAVGVIVLGLPVGAAVLLGAVLAPTDPVLATDVQVKAPGDDDRLRFSLTAEAGLNDGTAFPMVMLGLGLMGLHELGDGFRLWWAIDVVWATLSGFAVGGALGAAAGWIAHRLSASGFSNEFTEDLLGLGVIATAYGLSLLVLGYGFLAVFAAGFMLHRIETRLAAQASSRQPDRPSPCAMSPVTLVFIEQLERLMEVALILLIGGMFFIDSWQAQYVFAALLLLIVIRPVSVVVGLAGSREPWKRQAAIGWFGVKGIGSLYYLMYAIGQGVPEDTAVTLISTVLIVVALSILLHGISVKPLLRVYFRGDRT